MKFPLVAACLLATTLAQAQAPAAAPAEAPAEAPPAVPAGELQKLQAEIQRIDPQGRLTNEQLYDILMTREARRAEAESGPPGELFVLFSAVSFMAWLYASYRRERQRHETVRLMVEKGMEVPGALLAPPPKRPSDLRRGIILSTAGLGLTVCLALLSDMPGAWSAGLALFLIGLGHVLVWRLQGGRGPLMSALSSEPTP
jgi:hypothetical protein